MKGPLLGVVVGHGTVASALVQATEHISGIRDALVAVSNSGCDRDALERRVAAAVGEQRALVFVDLASGSCMFAAMRNLATREEVRVVTGVNLAMLLEFVFHRDEEVAAAAHRAAQAGARAIAER
jgi:mannose/fructose-specific phosphotransferase system component IIA